MNRMRLHSTTAALVAAVIGFALLLAMTLASAPVEAHGPRFQFETATPVVDTPVPPTVAPPTLPPPTFAPPTLPPDTPGPITPGAPTPRPAGGSKPEKDRQTGGPLAIPPGTAPTKFKLNSCAKVVRPSGLDLFVSPGFDSGYMQAVGVDQPVRVLGGPIGYDNLWWWKFRTPDGKDGWSVGDYAEPSAGPCVGGSTVLNLGNLPLTGVGGGGLAVGGVLVVVLIVAGVLRRRTRIR